MTGHTPAATAERSGFSIDTLRYYEKIGLLRDVGRDASGHRVFTDDHLAWLETLRCLRDTGMPIAQMQRYVALSADDVDPDPGPGADPDAPTDSLGERIALLTAHDDAIAARMAELAGWREHLRGKIAFYRELQQAEQESALVG